MKRQALRVTGLVIAVLAVSDGHAACVFCDQIVTLNDSLAHCYVEQYEETLVAVSAASRGYVSVDLSACSTRIDAEKGVAALPVPSGKVQFKTNFILDHASAVCLRKKLEAAPDTLEPAAAFNLREGCN